MSIGDSIVEGKKATSPSHPLDTRADGTIVLASDEGAKLLTGGEQATDGELGKGFFYRPTIFADVDPQMRIAQEEIFGPTTALIPVKNFDEALQVTNGIRYGLSSSIFTRDVMDVVLERLA